MQALAIDPVMEEPLGHSAPVSPPNGMAPSTPGAERPKLKGRQRLLRGLQRMSSSPSLAKLGRSRSSSNPYVAGDRASMSCMSLASASPYGSYGTYQSELSAGYSTAPTSVPGTPGPEVPFSSKPRTHLNGYGRPRTATLPSGLVTPVPLDEMDETEADYFSRPIQETAKLLPRRPHFNFWEDMPFEVRLEIFRFLEPREIVRAAGVSKAWYKMCFDGQLWSRLDVSAYYRDIPADSLVKIITNAGPFVRDLNLRGCVQLRELWNTNGLADACRNLENFSLEGCRIDRASVHCFLLQNTRLRSINLLGLDAATNAGLKIIGEHCPKLEELNVSWCKKIDAKGLKMVVQSCRNLRELRAGETRGWDDTGLALEIFHSNALERLVLSHCETLTDDVLSSIMIGEDPEVDILTDRPIVPPRRLKYLDLTRCRGITDKGLKTLAHNVPDLEGLQLSKCSGLTDDSLTTLLPTLSKLTHLDLEEVEDLTSATLVTLASAPCAPLLKHLCISYCESIGDPGVLPILQSCPSLTTLEMDNTRISDLSLIEAANAMRSRNRLRRGIPQNTCPTIGMRIIAFDCANVTWSGVREIFSCNDGQWRAPDGTVVYSCEVIALKCFYNWQPTVEEHSKRVLRGDFEAARRLRIKWHDWMQYNEEAGAGGGRHRRRRARRAQAEHADEEVGGDGTAGIVGGRTTRRRARSSPVCIVM